MNQKHYIAALKKALRGIDRRKRDDIILEIKGHFGEIGEHESLEQKFGSPAELASRYLEDEPLHTPVSKKIVGISKKLLLIIGSVLVALVLIFAILAWYWNSDKFDYANENAKELAADSTGWVSVPWESTTTIDINQSKIVLYWHDQNTLRSNCSNSKDFKAGEPLKIRHNYCLIYVPRNAVEINAEQAHLVLVRPQSSTRLNIMQTTLKIAENGAEYRFELEAKRSRMAQFRSKDTAAISLSIHANESQVEAYEY